MILDVDVSLSECISVWPCLCVSFSYLRSPCHAGAPVARPKLRARRTEQRKEHTQMSAITVSCLHTVDLEALNYS